MSNSSGTRRNSWWRRIIFTLVFLGFGGYFAYGVLRDAAMDLSQGVIPAGIPDSILENIKIDREIDGDLWKAEVGKAEQGKNWTSLYGIAVEVERGNGQVWTMNAPAGQYMGKNRSAVIESPEGTVTDGGTLFNYSAPLASWQEDANVIVFAKGFDAWGERGSFKAGHMTLIPGGIMEAEKGAAVKWFDPGGKN